jgi:uncharacterized protein YbjQ (UPF0145 family)
MPATPRGPGGDIPLDQQSGTVEIPQAARDRLSRMEGQEGKDGRRGLFTSDLSTNEFLLVKEAGFDPVGMVVGSSIYHVGYQPTYATGGVFGMGYTYQEQELTMLTQAKYNARELAMARMEAEAQALDADGIVGVRLEAGSYEWGRDLVEFIAVGTAVRARDKSASYRTRFGKPFTSDLSGQDLRTLLHAGYRPLGLTMGTSVYESFQNGVEFQQLYGYRWGMLLSGSYNVEVQRFTQAIYTTRDLAMGRMQREATQLGAEGIVGVQVKMESHLSKTDSEFESELHEEHAVPSRIWRTFLVDIFAVGTAVAPLGADHQIPTPGMVLALDG